MNISQLLSKNTIKLGLNASTKLEVIDILVDTLDKAGKLNDKEAYKAEILKREELSSTGIGDGIAIPHGKTSAVKEPSLALGIFKNGVDYDSLDDAPINIAFMIAASEGANNEHLETLSKLSVLLMNSDFKEGLLKAKTPDDVLNLLDEFEEKEESSESSESITSTNSKYIIAVTACPTGIAHTYMAADALKKKASELGYEIKVETNGSTGVKNTLTKEDIERADGIIVAADKNVEMARFSGKKVVIVPVIKAIKNTEELISKSISEEVKIYTHSGSSSSESSKSEKNGFYKHIMSGVSNMLPFVVGGGILIAISFMFGIKSADITHASYNPIAALLNEIGGGSAFALMIPVLAGFIGSSIADRPGFAPAMVGGIIAAHNGAGFLGGLIAGFLGGYSVIFLKKLFSKLPNSFEGIKPVLLYPLFGILITGTIMLLFIVSPVSYINITMQNWLGSLGTANKVLLGFTLAAMMAIDMGGPINKAAFTFGIAMIDAGNFMPHAAVMAGGMVPPLGIAIATTLFKHKFTKEERDSGKTNFIMGACFITEGAIPFAAADPLRIIPPCVIGAGIAGALSMAFNVTLPAPHGGLFVFPIVNNPLMYALAVIIGSIVTSILIGLIKKNID
ncbi:PTS fructose transporter subunit IIABC [Clostridium septicum]|uniref:Fructose-specific PTS transporter subunit EIIC n=1 Tax=Clostridium septicum TaxID=1504 RepID=A0A9N7PKR6_CLOSE|nr:fructose-specific PTS transporter subunit EIIC [Clostridium septicum]AYE33047.1 PTS fructose transporter subunit IIA [Clostridium septicum]MDU1313444.1 fructose-specific PTS transporter subunit EIIC [Clostridium septicum]QAS61216.1 PTS fructose transporter subunit IIA [Clostridium septicum]UEC19433.1 fructose-specific PTS transporter subunit EIIC [Clostridium septicum]USR99614.1 fructose-specific PTS transporter subunit EIIC [Clostridium septicum]